jgi:hypothetical protein
LEIKFFFSFPNWQKQKFPVRKFIFVLLKKTKQIKCGVPQAKKGLCMIACRCHTNIRRFPGDGETPLSSGAFFFFFL